MAVNYARGIRAGNGDVIEAPAAAGSAGDFFVSGGDGQPMQSLDSDAVIAALGIYTPTQIDTALEQKLEASDLAGLASQSYVDTAVSGKLSASDITSGTITPGTGDIDFDDLGGGLNNASDTEDGVLIHDGDGSTLGVLDVETVQNLGAFLPLNISSGNGGVWMRFGTSMRLLLASSGVGLYASIYGSADNSYDAGIVGKRLRTGRFATSVETPLVSGGGNPVSFDDALNLKPITKAALLALTASTDAGMYRVTDEGNAPVYPDDSGNFRYLTDNTVVS